MAMAAGVRTGGYFYSGRKRPTQAFDMVFPQMQGSFADMRQRRLAMEVVDREGRHKEDATFRHRVQQFGFFIEIAAVLDRVDAGLDRDAQPAAAERMAHDAAVEGVRLLGQRLHLVQIEGAVPRAVLWARAGAACRGAFDDIRTGPYDPTNNRANVGQAVDDAVWQQRVVRHAARKP